MGAPSPNPSSPLHPPFACCKLHTFCNGFSPPRSHLSAIHVPPPNVFFFAMVSRGLLCGPACEGGAGEPQRLAARRSQHSPSERGCSARLHQPSRSSSPIRPGCDRGGGWLTG